MSEYTIFLNFINGEVIEGCTYPTAEECWEHINDAIKASPGLQEKISFQVVEKNVDKR